MTLRHIVDGEQYLGHIDAVVGEQVGVGAHQAALPQGGEGLPGGNVGDIGQVDGFGQNLAAGGDGAGGDQQHLDIAMGTQAGNLPGQVGQHAGVGAACGVVPGEVVGAGLDDDTAIGRPAPGRGGGNGGLAPDGGGGVQQIGGHSVGG